MPEIEVLDLREKFFKVSNDIFNFGLNTYQLSIYFYLCRLANNTTKESFPSIRGMSKIIGCSSATIQKSINELCKKKIILKKEGDRVKSNRYYLLPLNAENEELFKKIDDMVYQEVTQGVSSDDTEVYQEVTRKKTHLKKTQLKRLNTPSPKGAEGYTNGKPPKEKHLDCIYITKNELNKLDDLLGKAKVTGYIEDLNNYIQAIGKPNKYKSHYHVILNWSKKDEPQKNKEEFPMTPELKEFYKKSEDKYKNHG